MLPGMHKSLSSNEHTLDQHVIFEKYLELYDSRITEYVGAYSHDIPESLASQKRI